MGQGLLGGRNKQGEERGVRGRWGWGGAADRESRERKRNARTYVEVGDLFVEGFGLVTREDVLHLLRYAFQKSLVNS